MPLRRPLLLALLLAACSGAAEEEHEAPPRLVVTAEAARDVAVDRLVLLGDVEGEVDVRVFAELPERIRTLHVTEGSRVEAGDPLATLEAALPSSELAQADAALAAAEASRDRLQADRDRIAPLVERQALPRSQLDSLEAQLRAAEAQVRQLEAGRRAAGVRRSRTVVRAPVAGVVAELQVSAGDMAAPQMPLARVVQMDRVKVPVQVVEEDYVRLREGMEVELAPPALPDVRLRGRIARVSPVLDRLTRTGEVEIEADNPEHVLRPGMVVEVGVELERREDVVLVPSRAIVMTTRTDEDRVAHVYVREGESAVRREVQLGRRYPSEVGESRVEITGGLQGGEEVVVEGQHMLRDGAAIRVEAPPEATAAVTER